MPYCSFVTTGVKDFQGISQNFKLQLEKRSSQIPVSTLSQTEFTGPCLSKLLLKVLVAISKKMEKDFVLSGTKGMDRI